MEEERTEYLAHIRIERDNIMRQTVKEHCVNVARYTSEYLKDIGLYNTGYLAGVLHDQGKFCNKFNEHIKESCFKTKRVSSAKHLVIHTFTPVIYLMERYHTGSEQNYETLTCEIIATAVGSHHGLYDLVKPDEMSGFEHRLTKDRDEICYEEAVGHYLKEVCSEDEIDHLFHNSVQEISELFTKVKLLNSGQSCMIHFTMGLIERILLSALIAGDRRDTGEFMIGSDQPDEYGDTDLWEEQIQYYEDKISTFNGETPINQVRCLISDQCRDAAQYGAGIYRLNVPTGGGKTLSSLRYALHHAAVYNKKRIIFITPLLSILDQNCQVIREYIKDQSLILEHHSNVITNIMSSEALDNYELLCDTWEKPVVISTMVQFLNILFHSRTTAIRRMHALIDSVIVLDEVQSIPIKFTYLFNLAINFLSEFCNCTIVLSSATQPCFEKLEIPIRYAKHADIIPYDQHMFEVFRRCKVTDLTTPYGLEVNELASFVLGQMEQKHSMLIICNTKLEAEQLYEQISSMTVDGDRYLVYHLSTSMCMQHRITTLKEIGKVPGKEGKKVICISTQLVEAGVDFSFECVIRLMAGMDNLVQAIGRCNRSWEWGKSCDVYIMNMKNEDLKRLKQIKNAKVSFLALRESYLETPDTYDRDIVSEKAIQSYYVRYMNPSMNNMKGQVTLCSGIVENLLTLLSDNRNLVKARQYQLHYFMNQAFKTAGDLFQVFDQYTYDVIVPYEKEGQEIIANLMSEKARYDLEFYQEQIAKAKLYTVSIFEYQKELLGDMLYPDQCNHVLILNPSCYDKKLGLVTHVKTEVNIDEYML